MIKKFDKFYFEGFEFDKATLVAKFYYSFDQEINFCEKIDFSADGFEIRQDLDLNIVNNFLFHLSIALGIGYYKAYPTDELVLKHGKLSDDQIIFWKKFYKKGLGEFLYRNKIKPQGLFHFVNDSKNQFQKSDFSSQEKYLVPIGGGKDSLVSIELLKKENKEFDMITFGKNYPIHEATSNVVGKKRLLITREMDQNLFKMNKEGYYNGHVPITGIIAFVLELVAYIYDYKYIVMSNEKSADYGNTTWEGLDINHQYSKSKEFENDLNQYVSKNISSSIKYYSILRNMYEIQIAKLFSKHKQYFDSFSSCNGNFKINPTGENPRWCNNCPKCAFVYSILRPYITKEETIQIFGEELFEKEELRQLFKELLGIDGIKPFECVGTNEEMVISLYYSYNKFEESRKNGEIKKLPLILELFQEKVLSKLDIDFFEELETKLFSN